METTEYEVWKFTDGVPAVHYLTTSEDDYATEDAQERSANSGMDFRVVTVTTVRSWA